MADAVDVLEGESTPSEAWDGTTQECIKFCIWGRGSVSTVEPGRVFGGYILGDLVLVGVTKIWVPTR